MSRHKISGACEGEFCGPCVRHGFKLTPATHKVEEVFFDDTREPARHPHANYLCCRHYCFVMGYREECLSR